jgi:hypothetical protein
MNIRKLLLTNHFQEEAEAIQPIDYTRAILEAKYGKK